MTPEETKDYIPDTFRKEQDALPEAVQREVDDWIGHGGRVLHFWKCGDTFLVTAETEHRLLFLRLFFIAGLPALSQDGDCALPQRSKGYD